MKSVIDMIIPILWKSLNNEVLTAEEQEMLDNWLEASVHNREVFTEIMDEEKRNNELKFLLNLDKQAAWEKISHAIEQHQPVPEAEVIEMNVIEPRKRWFFRFPAAAAAVLLILSGAGIYFLVNRQSKQEIAVAKPVKTGFPADPDSYIHPAIDRAIVTIADASGARLEEFDLREVQGNIVYNNGKNSFENIQKDKGSVVKFPEVALHPVDDQSSLTFNTLSTPKGGRYHVTLPDGSRVSLNAGSTLRFPSFFTTKERSVDLTGEAYFEVVKSKVPFYINVNKSKIEVLGTHFNVKGYPDEPETATTLIEGLVKVHKGNQTSTLKPGQQALVSNDDGNPVRPIRTVPVNTEHAVAWDNGFFILNNRTAEDIINEIARWYNLDVVLPNVKSGVRDYSGAINNEDKVTNVITMLKRVRINADIEGNAIVLHP